MRPAGSAHIPLFADLKEPTEIWYADRPPLLGGVPAKITIEAFKAKIKAPALIFSENIYVDSKELDKLCAVPYPKRPLLAAKIKSMLLNPSACYESLVVCNMGELGHGVFARKFIPPGAIVGFYAGTVTNSDLSTPYGLQMLESEKSTSEFSVDASVVGGIARFFQHLPANRAETADLLASQLKANMSYFNDYFLAKVEDDKITPEESMTYRYALTEDLYGSAELLKGMVQYRAKEEMQEWEVDTLEADAAVKDSIASANLDYLTLLVDRKPVVVFIASRGIAPGEQLGFAYGIGYWSSNVMKMPKLFTKRGEVLARHKYHWQSIPVAVESLIGLRTFFYSRKDYMAEIDDQRPKSFTPLAQRVSFFKLRKRLVEDGEISERHGVLRRENSFTDQMRKLFPEGIEFELYWHNPDDAVETKQYNADLYCKAQNKITYDKLKICLMESALRDRVVMFESNLEIIIRNVNRDTEKIYQFVLNQPRVSRSPTAGRS